MGRDGSCSITALVLGPFWRGMLNSGFFSGTCSAVIAHYCKNNGTEQEQINCLTAGEICWWQQPLPCPQAGLLIPRLGSSPLSSTPQRGAGTDLGREGWRSRGCKLWHSPNSLFPTPFLYLIFKLVRRKGSQDGPVLSLCPELYPQD